MKEISIDKFNGGINNYDLQSKIEDNQCASGSINVWAPLGALTKTPGFSTEYVNITATGTGISTFFVDDSINSSFQLYMRIGSGSVSTRWYPWAEGTTPLGYNTATAAVGANVSATGGGTSWSTHVSANDMFRMNATASAWFLVSSVEDDTHLTLAAAAPVATTGAYTIMPVLTDVGGLHSWASLNGSWWACTTANIMQRYDSTGMTRIPAAPKAAFLATHKNYLFAARTSTASSRLYWSAIKDPTVWTSTNFIDIDKDRGQITGIFSYGNELIVFKTHGMYKVVGEVFDASNPTYSVSPISVPSNFTFNSSRAVCVHNGMLYFYAYGQIYIYLHGTFGIRKISIKYQLDLSDTPSSVLSLGANEQLVTMISFMDYILVRGMVLSSITTNTAGILTDDNRWWTVRNTNNTTSSDMLLGPMVVLPASSLPSTGKPRVIMGSTTNPHIMQWDLLGFPNYDTNYFNPSLAAANVAIPSTWISKEFNIEYGTFKHIVIYLDKQTAGNLTLGWSIDQAAFVSNTIDMTTGRGQIIRSTLNINQKGTSIQLKITQSTASQTFRIYGIKIFYEPYTEDRKP